MDQTAVWAQAQLCYREDRVIRVSEGERPHYCQQAMVRGLGGIPGVKTGDWGTLGTWEQWGLGQHWDWGTLRLGTTWNTGTGDHLEHWDWGLGNTVNTGDWGKLGTEEHWEHWELGNTGDLGTLKIGAGDLWTGETLGNTGDWGTLGTLGTGEHWELGNTGTGEHRGLNNNGNTGDLGKLGTPRTG
jgi:hypothetical protein